MMCVGGTLHPSFIANQIMPLSADHNCYYFGCLAGWASRTSIYIHVCNQKILAWEGMFL